MTYTSIISNFLSLFNAAEKFLRSPSEGVAEGGGLGGGIPPRPSVPPSACQLATISYAPTMCYLCTHPVQTLAEIRKLCYGPTRRRRCSFSQNSSFTISKLEVSDAI